MSIGDIRPSSGSNLNDFGQIVVAAAIEDCVAICDANFPSVLENDYKSGVSRAGNMS